MKKFLVLILTMLYMGSATGATFHMHYCMNKLVDVQLWHDDDQQCGGCKAGKTTTPHKKCCKDEHKTVKLEKDHQLAENAVHQLQLAAAAMPASCQWLPPARLVAVAEAFPVSNAPPPAGKVPPHILHCHFRI